MSQSGLTQSLHALTATDIVQAIRYGHTTCTAVARACLEHIAVREPAVQAWQYLNADQVMAQARALDQRGSSGPLHGVPFGIKDIIDTYDMPTEYGSPIYRGHQPASDAACVALSRKAGGILMGKTVTTEFANVFPGKTRHPRDPHRTPGGSSSGSAAAVSACMVPLAVGTQTTGSTIRPASFCGIVGYRPTYGHLRCTGVKEAAGSFDTLGLMARSIADIALYRDVLLGETPAPPPTAPAVPPRIGFCRTALWSRLEPSTAHLLEQAATCLAQGGARVEEVALPGEFDHILDLHRAIASFEFARNFTYEMEHYWEQLSPALRQGRLRDGLACDFATYRAAQATLERCRTALEAMMAPYDVLLTASAAGEAPVGLQSTGDASFCALWTAAHVPALTLPVFTGPQGLPVGAQVIGKRHEDRGLFATAQWVWQRLTA
jgi:Asp-tRNA(Asn)/Glu-tRNA(Gln) amidotransferase A subunit family amidase